MKITRIIASIIVSAGVVFLGVGLTQLWDVKQQEKGSLEVARKFVQQDIQKVADKSHITISFFRLYTKKNSFLFSNNSNLFYNGK